MVRSRFGRISFRLLLLIVIATLPGCLLLLAIANLEWKLAEQEVQEQNFQLSQQIIGESKEQILEADQILKELARQARDPIQSRRLCNSGFVNLLQERPHFSNFGFVDLAGNVRCSAVPLRGPISVALPTEIQEILQTRSLVIGQFLISPVTNTPVLPIGYPVLDSNGRVISIVFASLKLDLLSPELVQQLPADSTIKITDRQGTVLVHHPNPEAWVGQSIRGSDLFQELIATQDDAITVAESQGLDQVIRLFIFSQLNPAQTTDIYIAIGIPQDQIQAAVRQTMWGYTLAFAIPTLGMIALAWYVASRGIQKPIQLLAQTARKISVGDFSARAELPSGGHEFDQLANAFNAMAAQLEEQIEQRVAVKKEREITELKAHFVTMVSHELRTPLTVMKVSADLLDRFEKTATEAQKQDYFRRMRSAIAQMQSLMDEILLLQRVESGTVELSLVAANPEEFCRNLVSELQMGIAQNRTVQLMIEGSCAAVLLDVDLLRAILTNLLSNALKYSSTDSLVNLKLTCQETQLMFEIRDRGIGIPPADQLQLFSTFHRAGNVSNIPGTGLGLAIVKRCVDIYKGTVSFESTEGIGTTFRVTIPVERV